MKRKVLSIVAGALIAALLLAMITIIGVQRKELNQYENGFKITGTWVTEDNQNYLVFAIDEKNTFYAYKQFEVPRKGVYQKTANPNIYEVEMKDTLKGHVVLGKDSLTCVEGENVTNYIKKAEIEIFIEPNEEYLTK